VGRRGVPTGISEIGVLLRSCGLRGGLCARHKPPSWGAFRGYLGTVHPPLLTLFFFLVFPFFLSFAAILTLQGVPRLHHVLRGMPRNTFANQQGSLLCAVLCLVVCVAWCLVPGAWCLVPGAWCLLGGGGCVGVFGGVLYCTAKCGATV